MEGMLKTWKEPVPGSLDPRSVFPPETVRPIENALIKAKTAALQSSRQVQTQPQPEYRNTPTPPQYSGRFNVPPSQGQGQPYYGYGVQQVRSSSDQRGSPDLSAKLFSANTSATTSTANLSTDGIAESIAPLRSLESRTGERCRSPQARRRRPRHTAPGPIWSQSIRPRPASTAQGTIGSAKCCEHTNSRSWTSAANTKPSL